ncbi:hypothetical protein TNCV_2928951 [Trichonephila clavipes]|nr:hypothetical protein TNCV_2928951 [Trichonephila clavipes]
MKFSEGSRSFEMCTNCSSEPASTTHILECLGLTKQNLAVDPLLVLDFLGCTESCTGLALLANGGVQQTATAGSDVVQSGRPIFDDFFQHLWPYIGNNTANVVFQMVKRL